MNSFYSVSKNHRIWTDKGKSWMESSDNSPLDSPHCLLASSNTWFSPFKQIQPLEVGARKARQENRSQHLERCMRKDRAALALDHDRKKSWQLNGLLRRAVCVYLNLRLLRLSTASNMDLAKYFGYICLSRSSFSCWGFIMNNN